MILADRMTPCLNIKSKETDSSIFKRRRHYYGYTITGTLYL